MQFRYVESGCANLNVCALLWKKIDVVIKKIQYSQHPKNSHPHSKKRASHGCIILKAFFEVQKRRPTLLYGLCH